MRLRLLEFAHVGGHSRYAKQAGPLVDQFFDRARIHAAFVHQVKDHPWVKAAASGSHHQAVDSRKAHCGCDAVASVHSAQARAVAEVGNDHFCIGQRGRSFVEPLRNIFVGETVEAVAAHPQLGNLSRQGEHLRECRLRAMEGCIEARDLRNVRRLLGDGINSGKIMGLVQWRKRTQLSKSRSYNIVKSYGRPRSRFLRELPDGQSHRPSCRRGDPLRSRK